MVCSPAELKELKVEILEIREQLDRIERLLTYSVVVERHCEKMGNHIDFIESIYETIRHPLSFLINKINTLSTSENSSNHISLPSSKK
jgi:hypothetical protein